MMAIYSITDLEKLSGIKAHTIRIWEQRYELIAPNRTKTNIRYYDDDNLKKLLNIALLNKNGIKISKIAEMSADEISGKVTQFSEIRHGHHDTQLDALTIAMIHLDEPQFSKILAADIDKLGFEQVMMQIIFPFLDRLNLMRFTGSVSPVQENFIGQLLRQKVICAIEKEQMYTGSSAKKFMVFMPQSERQELSFLFLYHLIKIRKHHVIYLGQDIVFNDLKDALSIFVPDFVFTFLNDPPLKMSLQNYVRQLSEIFADSKVLISGFQVVSKDLETPKNVSLLKSLHETLYFLEKIS